MSNSQGYEEVTVRSDGVTVTKRFEEGEFPVPAIAFEFSSEREETVRVRLSDAVPDRVAVEDLGFHPEYGSEYWEIDDDRITFERELDAGSEYTTVYGIRATGTDNIETFLTEPDIEAVDPPLPGESVAVATNDGGDVIQEQDDVVRDVIAGDGDVPGLEDTGEESEEDVEKLDLTDPTDSEHSEGDGGGARLDSESSLVSVIAEEIRSEDVTSEDLRLLGRAIDHVTEDATDGTTEARVQQLQSDIADLRAYTNAIEEFLDEEGTGQQLIEEFESELSTFRSRLEGMSADLEENTASVEAVRDDMDDVRAIVEGTQSDVERVDSAFEDLEDRLGSLESTVERLERDAPDEEVVDRLETMESDLADLREWQEQIKKTFGG